MQTQMMSIARISPLTVSQLEGMAPAAFAKVPAQRMTESYTMVRTYDVIEALAKIGMVATMAVQRRSSRDRLSARHMVRMMHKNDIGKVTKQVGEVYPELVLSNAHNGRASFRLHMGLFRLICGNGLVVADTTFGSMVRRHTGDLKSIMEQAVSILDHGSKVMPLVGKMERLMLTEAQRIQYAQGALEARYSLEEGDSHTVTPQAILVPRRKEDNKPSLWRTYNTVQENLMRGGVEGKSATGRVTHTREMNNVGRSLYLNEKLWEQAVAMMQ